MKLIVGAGNRLDRVEVIPGGGFANRVLLDNAIKYSHKVGTWVLAFDSQIEVS